MSPDVHMCTNTTVKQAQQQTFSLMNKMAKGSQLGITDLCFTWCGSLTFIDFIHMMWILHIHWLHSHGVDPWHWFFIHMVWITDIYWLYSHDVDPSHLLTSFTWCGSLTFILYPHGVDHWHLLTYPYGVDPPHLLTLFTQCRSLTFIDLIHMV